MPAISTTSPSYSSSYTGSSYRRPYSSYLNNSQNGLTSRYNNTSDNSYRSSRITSSVASLSLSEKYPYSYQRGETNSSTLKPRYSIKCESLPPSGKQDNDIDHKASSRRNSSSSFITSPLITRRSSDALNKYGTSDRFSSTRDSSYQSSTTPNLNRSYSSGTSTYSKYSSGTRSGIGTYGSSSGKYTFQEYRPSTARSYSYNDTSKNDVESVPSWRRSSLLNNADSSGSEHHPNSTSMRNEKPGLVGLHNLGNTCYMNSILQCLCHTRPLIDLCLQSNYAFDYNASSSARGSMIKAFSDLVKMIWQNNVSSQTNLISLKNEVHRFAPRFSGYNQHDAQEFLRYLLQGLHEDINQGKKPSLTYNSPSSSMENESANEGWRRYLKTDNSRIIEFFVGQLQSTLQCSVCMSTSVTYDPFWDLSLPIPKNIGVTTLEQCFNLFASEEILDGDDKPECQRCKMKRRCTKQLKIHKFPKILVLHLKRFTGDGYHSKLSTNVDFPVMDLDLRNYMASSCKDHWLTYNLYAISNHIGSAAAGHYTAYCLHHNSGEWYEFNDEKVSRINANDIVSPKAYILFYEMASQSSRY